MTRQKSYAKSRPSNLGLLASSGQGLPRPPLHPTTGTSKGRISAAPEVKGCLIHGQGRIEECEACSPSNDAKGRRLLVSLLTTPALGSAWKPTLVEAVPCGAAAERGTRMGSL